MLDTVAYLPQEQPSPTACLKVTATPPLPRGAALKNQYSIASFAALLVLSSLRSPGLPCLCCKVVRFFCDLEARDLVTTAVGSTEYHNVMICKV